MKISHSISPNLLYLNDFLYKKIEFISHYSAMPPVSRINKAPAICIQTVVAGARKMCFIRPSPPTRRPCL